MISLQPLYSFRYTEKYTNGFNFAEELRDSILCVVSHPSLNLSNPAHALQEMRSRLKYGLFVKLMEDFLL